MVLAKTVIKINYAFSIIVFLTYLFYFFLYYRIALVTAPELRPKGLGLGATKILKENLPVEISCDYDRKSLVLKKGALAKIVAGSHKGQYCEV